ncbi:MAG: YciI family protein [Proteobacteria bacterium]|nr:YciI family protein [Pseudomonadota bacterium]
MKFALLIRLDEAAQAAEAKAKGVEHPPVSPAYAAYAQAAVEAGVMRGGQRLRPSSTATTVRVRDGQTHVLDGPYAEAKEQLGGVFLIEAATLEEAVQWAAKCPGAATGALEVRAVWE